MLHTYPFLSFSLFILLLPFLLIVVCLSLTKTGSRYSVLFSACSSIWGWLPLSQSAMFSGAIFVCNAASACASALALQPSQLSALTLQTPSQSPDCSFELSSHTQLSALFRSRCSVRLVIPSTASQFYWRSGKDRKQFDPTDRPRSASSCL
jgi:hypothetical protein